MKNTLRLLVVAFLALGSPALANPSRYPILPYSPNSATEAQCNIQPAREQAELAKRALDNGNVDQAYKLAGSAWQYLGSCHRHQGDDRTAGDAMFIIAIVEAKRGQGHLASIDSGIATAEYQFCYENPKASKDDAAYCHAMEAKIDSMTH
jgi:hypothetical protein